MGVLKTLPIFSLEGKTCLVTGGTGGLGRECIVAFAQSGARCACVDLDLATCQTTAREISAELSLSDGAIRPYTCNVADEAQVEKTVSRIVQDFGQIDVLVTCAGTCILRPTAETDLALWRKVLDVNLDGTYLFARNVGRHMLERGIGGSMVFIASVAGTQVPTPQLQASYNASKAALKLLAASLGKEWALRGIRVNCLSPGYMDTKLMNVTANKGPVTDTKEQWLKQIPMGRFARPDELCASLVYLASAASSYATGMDLVVDGGWSA